jgi:hypothetical protein
LGITIQYGNLGNRVIVLDVVGSISVDRSEASTWLENQKAGILSSWYCNWVKRIYKKEGFFKLIVTGDPYLTELKRLVPMDPTNFYIVWSILFAVIIVQLQIIIFAIRDKKKNQDDPEE